MTILHIVGKPRQGKGILATFLGLYVADAGNPVDSNYHMQSENVHWIDFYELLSFLKKPRQSPSHLLIIDELPGWCDSYVTQAKSNRFATHFLNQSQKLGYDLIFTSQRRMRSDINFRELSDVACKAEKDEANKVFRYKWLDPEETEEDIETGSVTKIPYDLAAQFWERYDTYECVPPLGLDEMLSEMQKSDPVRFRVELDRLVDKLLPVWEAGEAVNRLSVTSALLDAGEPYGHAQLVAYRLAKRLRQMREPQLETQTPMPQAQETELRCLDRWKALRKA